MAVPRSVAQKVERLRREIREHEYRYYVLDQPTISDRQFDRLMDELNPAIELGRSFVRPEYQRSYTPLLLLWKGIGQFVAQHPQYRVLFGPVSISSDYQSSSQQLLVEFLRANGLALGGSLDSAIVMDDCRVLNAEGLRYADEFAKHKVLDAVGDFYLTGHPLMGAISAFKSGHGLNNKLLRAVIDDAGAWEWATSTDPAKTPQALLKLSALPS